MSTIKELLGQGDTPKPRKNFLQENVRRLREMKPEKTNKMNSQRNKNLQPLTDRRNVHPITGSTRQQAGSHVPLRNSPNNSRRLGAIKPKQVEQEIREEYGAIEETPKGFRNQECQTLSSKELQTLYHEGVIRYPSARMKHVNMTEPSQVVTVRDMGLQTDTEVQVLLPPSHVETGLHWDEEKYDPSESSLAVKDFVKMNATIPEAHINQRSLEYENYTRKSDPNRAPPSYQRGVVPRYLKEHKKELERERITKAKESADECPEGHILLPDDVRHKHLTTLRLNYAGLVSQLNQLPVSTDTLRTRDRKKQIEADLDKIEAAIALFSREKVFVKADS